MARRGIRVRAFPNIRLDNKMARRTVRPFRFTPHPTMKYLASLILGFAFLFSSAAPAVTTVPTEPTIESIRGRIVKIRVPAGFDRVTLQQFVVPRRPVRGRAADRWRTLATKYPRGAEMVIVHRLPMLIAKRYLRVYGSRAEPLPGSLFTGITSFLPDAPEADLVVNREGPGASMVDTNGMSSNSGVNLGSTDAAPRTLAESDIWKVQGNRIYFFNELRGLQVFDLANPAAPVLLGTLRLPGAGDDLYLLGNSHAVLLKRASGEFGWPVYFGGGFLSPGIASPGNAGSLSGDVSSTRLAVQTQGGGTGSGEIIVADVRDGAPKLVARVPYEGTLAESRMVGSVLYLATNVYRTATDTDAAQYGLELSSFDLAEPAAPVKRDSIFLGGWANAVTATDKFFLVAKYAQDGGSWSHNAIDLIDISAPDGTMKRAGLATVRGNISSKFNLSIDGDILIAVTQCWGPIDGDEGSLVFRPVSFTDVQTFSIADPSAPALLGTVSLAPGETVRATRFDTDRVYVVTFRQVDPLFVVNLKDPARPSVSGEVEAPGFSTYIEPLGDRLVTIGLVNWQPAVSLFDVADPAAPKLLSQIKLGAERGWANSEAVWNEKAFKVLPEDNLILVPVSGAGEGNGWFSRVQLIDLLPDKLVKRGSIVREFSPRRATMIGKCIVTISPTRLVTVNAADRDKPVLKADLEIAWSVNRVFNIGRFLVQVGGSADWNDHRAPMLSVSPSDDTNETLTSLDLVNLPVLGATVKDDVLYLAQGEGGYYFNGDLAKRPLTASAYDLSRLPAIRLLGSASASIRFVSGDLAPLWPSPGILVWSGTGGGIEWVGNAWYDPEPYTVQKIAPAADATGGEMEIIDPPGYWTTDWFYSQPKLLVAFDFTRPEAPKFLSDIAVGTGRPWDLSDPFAADGVLLFSYKFLGNVKTSGDSKPLPDAGSEPDSPRAKRHYLVRADYADPAAPVIDDTEINLPGKLTGLARGGKLLFTVGRNYDLVDGSPKPGETALQVSAFDGAAAHLLDTLPLVSRWQPVSIQGETVFALDAQPAWLWRWEPSPLDGILAPAVIGFRGFWGGGTSTENPKTSLLSAWKLDEAGKFNKLGDIEVAHDMSLFVFGGLVVTLADSRTVHVFNGSNPAKFESLGEYKFNGWVWPDLSHADGGLNTGLWVPLGQYGVETVAAPAAAK